MSRLLAKIQRDRLDQEHQQLVARALLEGNIDLPRSAGADPARLRGIPAIGHNVQGHIPGTHPEQQALSMRGSRA